MIELGSKVRDKLTGFVGIAVARTIWLYGCDRYALSSQKLKDGMVRADEWFDEGRLEVLAVGTFPAAAVAAPSGRGGPRNDRAAIRRGPVR